MPAGRPTDFTLELGLKIIDEMIENDPPDNTIRKICASNDKYPSDRTFYSWLSRADNENASEDLREFLQHYKEGLKKREEKYQEECLDIAYDESNDILIGAKGEKGNSTAVSRAKLKIDTLQWLLKVSNPKKYGDRIEQHHSGDVTINAADALIQALGQRDKE